MNITSENEYRFAQIKAVMLFILKSFPSGVDFIKLYKIMYFAQKKFLSQYGKIIFDDSFVAKKLGPGKTVVTVLPDTAERYYSTLLFGV